MAGKNPDEVLTIGVGLEADAALKHMAKFERAMRAQFKQVGATSKKETRASVDGFKRMADAVDDLTDSTDKYEKVLKGLRQRASEASDESVEGLEAQIELVEKIIRKNREAQKHAPKRGSKEDREDPKEAKQKANAALKESAEAFRDAASSFFSKDAKGVFSGLMKSLGSGLKGSLKRVELGSTNLGATLGKTGAGIAERGREKGGMGGAAMTGIGKALQGMSGIFAKLGPLLNTVSKLGPLLGVASSALLAVVKLFIDAEAQAKQFQKEVLQSASTTEFLAASAGNANVAYMDLESTMRSIRDAAHEWDNIKWGITADEHKQVLNVLNQEGASLHRLRQEAKATGKSMGKFVSDLTHVSVAYSRAFGVPLQEINQMQAEMMTDLGMSLEQTRLQFAQMTRSASESGIAANKFFAIIRGVSADLSLYNSRLEDAVKTLKALGKVMNPREAQKFMQTAMQGLKNMGRQERLRMTLLAGTGKMSKLIERDMKTKQESIAKQIAETGRFSADEAAKTLQSGNINDMINKLPDEMQGAIREGVIQLDLQKSRSGKGVFGVSGASANLGPAGALEAFRSALKGWGGGSSLREGAGTIGMEMMAENLGISQEQLDQMIKFEAAMDMERETLKSIFAKQAAGQALTADEQARLQKAQEEGIKNGTDVDAAGYDQIYATMDENQKKQHEDATKVESLGEKQARLTNSVLDKLGTLVDWVMNQLYNVLVGIWDVVLSIGDKFGITDAAAQRARFAAEKSAGKYGFDELSKAASTQDVAGKNAFGAAMAGTNLTKSMNSALKDYEVAQEKFAESADKVFELAQRRRAFKKEGKGTWTEADEAALGKARAEKDAREEANTKLIGLVGEMASGFNAKELAEAMRWTSVSPESVAKFQARVAGGEEAGTAAVGSLSRTELSSTLSKIPWMTEAHKGRITDVMGRTGQRLETMGYYSGADGKTMDPKIFETTSVSTEATAKSSAAVKKAVTTPHTAYFKFSNSFLRGDYQRTMEEIMLGSLRQALFEFYMYSQMDPSEVAKFLGEEGMSAKEFAETVGKKAEEGRTPKDFTGLDYVEADKNAAGGLVTSVNGGLAMVRAAAGEGLASIGPGERILPAGAGRGGDQFNINVNGIGGNDLARFLQVKVADGIVEYKRRQRFA